MPVGKGRLGIEGFLHHYLPSGIQTLCSVSKRQLFSLVIAARVLRRTVRQKQNAKKNVSETNDGICH